MTGNVPWGCSGAELRHVRSCKRLAAPCVFKMHEASQPPREEHTSPPRVYRQGHRGMEARSTSFQASLPDRAELGPAPRAVALPCRGTALLQQRPWPLRSTEEHHPASSLLALTQDSVPAVPPLASALGAI